MPEFMERGLRTHIIWSCVWCLGVLVMWWGATTSALSALIAVPVVAGSSFGMGYAWHTWVEITEPYRKQARMKMEDVPYYKYEDGEISKLSGFHEWAVWHHTHGSDCLLKRSTFGSVGREEPSEVSTVFIGIGHLFDLKGRPLLFETMIMSGPLAGQEWKTASYDEAMEAHITATLMVKALLETVHDPARRARNAHLN